MLDTYFILTIIFASTGFVISIVSLLGGQQFTKSDAPRRQSKVHRVTGYLSLVFYCAIASVSIIYNPKVWVIILWLLGLLFYYIKIRFVRSKKGYRKYSSRLGLILFFNWIVIIVVYVVLFNS
ncbi:MAG: hypothetical protein OEV44_14490 [Spirochaetota bacterium]|nr:hypothetical protein [Spirochaetota bacterium]